MTGVTGVVDAPVARPPLARVVSDYVALTKPRIIELLLVTTVPAMMLAARGFPRLSLLAATLGYGTLAAASANVLNCYLDREIDAVMTRTSRRALHRGTISPARALVFGGALGSAAVTGFWFAANPLSAALAAAAIAFYVLVYTAGLKRRTPSNIVWGGAAGCMPVLIGWSAVTGRLGWPPLVLFGVVFLWTPPHFWALAIRFRDDYASAGVPMLPVVASTSVVAGRIVAYSWATVVASLALWPVASTTPAYPVAAAALGAWLLSAAYALRGRVRRDEPPRSLALFRVSISYLSLLSCCVAADTLLRHVL